MLYRGITALTNVPVIWDVVCMLDILEFLDTRYCHKGDCLVIDTRNITQTNIPERYVTAIRSSIVVLNVLPGCMGGEYGCYPGGCLTGTRPINLHLMILRSLGAGISETERYIRAACGKGLTGTEIRLPYPSVGAAEQAILGSVLTRDVTIMHGAAREPKTSQFCCSLNNMGAVICGTGTDHLVIQGAEELYNSNFRVEGGRIITSTYVATVAAVMGSMVLREVCSTELEAPLEMLKQAGISVRIEKRCKQIRIEMKQCPDCLNIKTGPYPQFPTDLQSSFMAFLVSGGGTSTIEERVFEGRLAAVRSLIRMGVSIGAEKRKAVIEGHYSLKKVEVSTLGLRGGAVLVVAVLAARGEALIRGYHHIERGYEDICRDMAVLGANVRWLERE